MPPDRPARTRLSGPQFCRTRRTPAALGLSSAAIMPSQMDHSRARTASLAMLATAPALSVWNASHRRWPTICASRSPRHGNRDQDPGGNRADAGRRPPGGRSARLHRARTSSRASPPANSTGCATTTWSSPAGDHSGAAELRPAGLPPYPEVDLHLGQPPGLPRRPRRPGAEDRRHRQHRHHGDQGRLPRRHQPHVLCRASRRSRPGACAKSPTNACGAASTQVRPGARLGDIGHAIQTHAEATATAWCANSAATASAAGFTKNRRCCTTAGPAPAIVLEPGMTFTVEPMINAGRARYPRAGGRLDHRHQGSQPVGAVGAHRAGDRTGFEVLTVSARHAGRRRPLARTWRSIVAA